MDSRLREAERAFLSDPGNQSAGLHYIRECLRVNHPIELTLITPALALGLASTQIPLPLVRIFGRQLQDVMADIQGYKRDEPGLGLGNLQQWIHQNYPHAERFREWEFQRSLARLIQDIIPDVDLDDEREYSIVGLFYVAPTDRVGPTLLVLLRTDHTVRVENTVLTTYQDFTTHNYYSIIFSYNGSSWEPALGSIYEQGPPLEEELSDLYAVFGNLNNLREDYETTIDEINAEQESVEDYRNRVAETIDQTYITVHEERGNASVTLWDRFTDEEIASWYDQDVFELIEDGFFQGAFDDHQGGEFHQSVYNYAYQHQLLPWQSSSQQARRNPDRPLAGYYAVTTDQPQIRLLAHGLRDALEKAARHFQVTYDPKQVEQETSWELDAPMLSVKYAGDGRYAKWLQAWANMGT